VQQEQLASCLVGLVVEKGYLLTRAAVVDGLLVASEADGTGVEKSVDPRTD
jgi:hypothetical protein